MATTARGATGGITPGGATDTPAITAGAGITVTAGDILTTLTTVILIMVTDITGTPTLTITGGITVMAPMPGTAPAGAFTIIHWLPIHSGAGLTLPQTFEVRIPATAQAAEGLI